MRKTVLYLSAASLFLSSYTLKNDKEYSLAEEHIKICLRLLRVING